MADTPMTVVEAARFLKDAKLLMSDSEREELVVFVGANPEAGEIIPETGGIRKIRWALAGRGKRGGARVIYYYHNRGGWFRSWWRGIRRREGGYGENEGENQAGGEEGGPSCEQAAYRRRAHHRGVGAGDSVDARRERKCPRDSGACAGCRRTGGPD
jgi:hypothetical protein